MISEIADEARARGVPLTQRGNDFVRSLIAIAVSKGDLLAAPEIAEARWGSRSAAVTKSAVEAMSTGNTAAAAMFVGTAAEFFATVGQRTIVGRLANLRKVPMRTRLLTATSAAASWVGEAQAKPLSNVAFSASTLASLKILAVAVQTDEVLTGSDPATESVIRADLTRAVVEAVDLAFVDPTNAGTTDVKPASITNAVTPITSLGISDDLGAMVDGFEGDLEAAYLIMSPKLAARLTSAAHPNIGARGGTLSGIPVITSSHVSDTVMVLVDPTAVAFAEGAPEARVITQGTVLMDTEPAMASFGSGSPSEPVAAQMVSLWQTNAVAFVVGRFVNWSVIRAGSVVLVEDVGVGSP